MAYYGSYAPSFTHVPTFTNFTGGEHTCVQHHGSVYSGGSPQSHTGFGYSGLAPHSYGNTWASQSHSGYGVAHMYADASDHVGVRTLITRHGAYDVCSRGQEHPSRVHVTPTHDGAWVDIPMDMVMAMGGLESVTRQFMQQGAIVSNQEYIRPHHADVVY
jgi:hypothetical protein